MVRAKVNSSGIEDRGVLPFIKDLESARDGLEEEIFGSCKLKLMALGQLAACMPATWRVCRIPGRQGWRARPRSGGLDNCPFACRAAVGGLSVHCKSEQRGSGQCEKAQRLSGPGSSAPEFTSRAAFFPPLPSGDGSFQRFPPKSPCTSSTPCNASGCSRNFERLR